MSEGDETIWGRIERDITDGGQQSSFSKQAELSSLLQIGLAPGKITPSLRSKSPLPPKSTSSAINWSCVSDKNAFAGGHDRQNHTQSTQIGLRIGRSFLEASECHPYPRMLSISMSCFREVYQH